MSVAIDLTRLRQETLPAATSATVPGIAAILDLAEGLYVVVCDGPLLVTTSPQQGQPVSPQAWPWSPVNEPLYLDHRGGKLAFSAMANACTVRVVPGRVIGASSRAGGSPFGGG